MSLTLCKEIAARIWCDQDMVDQVMDVKAAEDIAQIIYRVRNRFNRGDKVVVNWPDTWINQKILTVIDAKATIEGNTGVMLLLEKRYGPSHFVCVHQDFLTLLKDGGNING